MPRGAIADWSRAADYPRHQMPGYMTTSRRSRGDLTRPSASTYAVTSSTAHALSLRAAASSAIRNLRHMGAQPFERPHSRLQTATVLLAAARCTPRLARPLLTPPPSALQDYRGGGQEILANERHGSTLWIIVAWIDVACIQNIFNCSSRRIAGAKRSSPNSDR
eukprot:COSAG06_NODE_10170_length_1736_cov_1.812462_2_plen_164_part_00